MEKFSNTFKIRYRRIAETFPNWNDICNMDVNKLDEMVA